MTSNVLRWPAVCLLFCAVASAQTTPNIGLALPPINSSNWGTKLNNNMTILDGLLSGNANVPGLHLSGNFQLPSSPSFSTIGGGFMGYDSTANVYVAGNNSVAIRFPYVIGSAPSGCAQWGANYALTGTGVACGVGGGGITGPGSSTNLFIPQWNGTSGNSLLAGLGVTTVIGTPGVDTNVPTEKAVRNAISAAGGGNVSTAGSLTIGNVMIGAGGTNIQDSGKAIPSGPFADTNSAQTFTNKSIGASQIDSGTLAAARLPLPTSSTLGGIQSIASVASMWISSISTSGVPTATQPGFSDLAGSIAVGQTTLTTTQDILYRNGSSLGRLPIVANGSCLGATSGTWASVACAAGTSPLTTKGDLFGFSTLGARLPVGATGLFVMADSTATLGLSYQPPFTLGPNGTLSYSSGVLDTDNSVVPRLTNSSDVLANWTYEIGQDWVKQASGSTPGAGKIHPYANTDNTPHYVTSDGVDHPWTGGGVTTKWGKAYNTTGQSIPGSFTTTTLLFNTSDPGTTDATMHSTSSNTGRLVAPTTGIYEGNCNVFSSTTGTSTTVLTVSLNGTQTVGNGANGVAAVGGAFGYNAPFSTPMTAGEFVVCQVTANTAFTTDPGNGITQFYMSLVH